MKEKDINSLDHTSWRCQYHIVFAPKYRRQAIYREIKVDIGKILRKLCDQKGVEIIEAELCPDHVHMLVSIPPKYSVSQIMGYLKGKSSLMIFDRHANLKYKYGNRHFWARGYYVDTVGRNKKQIQEYIKHQLDEDQIAYQMSIKEYIDPFTGKVSDERYATLSMSYEEEQQELKNALPEMQRYLETETDKTESLQKFIDKVKRITQIKELTPELVHEFIDKIVVYAPRYLDGKRVQLMDIYYNGVGILRELTPEEMDEAFQKHIAERKEKTA